MGWFENLLNPRSVSVAEERAREEERNARLDPEGKRFRRKVRKPLLTKAVNPEDTETGVSSVGGQRVENVGMVKARKNK